MAKASYVCTLIEIIEIIVVEDAYIDVTTPEGHFRGYLADDDCFEYVEANKHRTVTDVHFDYAHNLVTIVIK